MATRQEFAGKDNYGKPKSQYVGRIMAMTDEELLKESELKIWLSAYAANNRRSDFHWHVDVIYDEWCAREKVDQYSKAFETVCKQCGR